ncbi:MAG TPA: hypothetical protein VJP40_07770, partial [bacterium]|nr:hypothetical protein [bacterium]
PLEPRDGPGPPELEREDWLLQKMAIEPLDSSAARIYARRRYPMYFLIAVACIGLPGALIVTNLLYEWGFPVWVSQVGMVLVLGAFFVFFFVMIAWMLSRSKVLKHLGIAPVEGPARGTADDVSILAKRHGRMLEYGVSASGNFWRYGKAVPEFQVENKNGQFFVSSGVPPSIRDFLSGLPRNKRWRGLRIHGGARGMRTSRPVRQANLFLHDLWLFEGLLNATEK